LPTLLKLYRADRFLVNKIVASATVFLRRSPQRPQTSVPRRVRSHVLTFVDRLGSDPAYASRIDGLKRDLLARPELGDLARQRLVECALVLRAQRLGRVAGVAASIGADVRGGRRRAGRWTPKCAPKSTRAWLPVLRSVIAEQKSGVSTFISDQVKSWDMGQLIALIEINIGPTCNTSASTAR